MNANKNVGRIWLHSTVCHPERSRGILTTRVARSLGFARDDKVCGNVRTVSMFYLRCLHGRR